MTTIWKLPDNDDDKLKALQAAIVMDEIIHETDRLMTDGEIIELKYFVRKYEGERTVLHQTNEERNKALAQYRELFKNAKTYISHFIQVLQLTVIRNEIRVEHLGLYGFEEGKELVLPELATEEDILAWGEKIIQGEAARLQKGGIPLYNPAIAKVKVHFELFKDIVQSLKIFRQNVSRTQNNLREFQKTADNYIERIWTAVEDRNRLQPVNERHNIRKQYKMTLASGEQLNVFD
jgi:hypothetical protein